FQAEAGIRDATVTGVQTCALPICRIAPFGVETAGRWSRARPGSPLPEDQIAVAIAWQLLRRYGVVFRRLVARETLLAPWRDILQIGRAARRARWSVAGVASPVAER